MNATKRIIAFDSDPHCPKCGTHALSGPYYHGGRLPVFLQYAFGLPMLWLCWGTTLDHLHFRCVVCGVWHMRACRDIRERL